jgi:hypothetical protein
MGAVKIIKDRIIKTLSGQQNVPRGLFELEQYLRSNHSINFRSNKEDGLIVAISTDFKHGSIIAHGASEQELDKNIIDAILTSFEIPSVYKNDVRLQRLEKSKTKEYAFA